VRDALKAGLPSPSVKSMEQLILVALAARPGGDLVYRRNKNGELFCLGPGIHDMRAVVREVAERSGRIDAEWMSRFYRAWRSLCDGGALEAPDLIQVTEVFSACQRRVHNLNGGTYIDGGRNRLYVRLTGRPAPQPRPAVVCRACGVDLPSTHRLRKWCTACKAKLFKHRNMKAAAERLKERHVQLAGAKCECCGNNFTAVRSNQLFCSSTCKQTAYRKRKAKIVSSKI
jgi:hypothetical protein